MNLGEWTLVRPSAKHAFIIASWLRSAQEAGHWCVRAHPFPVTAITASWARRDVSPLLLLDPTGVPAAYGELWDNQDGDEFELARLVLDPDRRVHDVGMRLVGGLVELARRDARSHCILRVAPGDRGAVEVARLVGFRDVNDSRATEWNRDQPTSYRWLEHPDFPGAVAQ